jgi:hypothetical protein
MQWKDYVGVISLFANLDISLIDEHSIKYAQNIPFTVNHNIYHCEHVISLFSKLDVSPIDEHSIKCRIYFPSKAQYLPV